MALHRIRTAISHGATQLMPTLETTNPVATPVTPVIARRARQTTASTRASERRKEEKVTIARRLFTELRPPVVPHIHTEV